MDIASAIYCNILSRKEKKHEQRRFSQRGFQSRKNHKGCSGGRGLCSFKHYRGAEGRSKGRNPQTGEEIDIAARKVPKFVAGKALKEAVK
jgi:hypothetical protein